MPTNTHISAKKEHRAHKGLSAFIAPFRGKSLSVETGCLLCLFILITGCAKPELPEGGFAAKAVLSPNELHVGDVVTLTMTARHAPGSTVEFPTLGNRKQVIVRGRSSATSVVAEGVLETEEIVRLTSLRTGHWLITTNAAICTFADGSRKAQALPALTLNVASTLDESNAGSLSDIKGPVRDLKTILWVVLLIIAAALIAGLITRWFMKRPKALLAAAPPVPPHLTAKASLAALKNEAWEPEPFFVKLSLILRTYLEDRFNLNAPESTTEELAEKLRKDSRLNVENRQTMNCFFEQSDLVKFARAGAEQEVMQTAFETVEQFVNQTTEKLDPQKSAENTKETSS